MLNRRLALLIVIFLSGINARGDTLDGRITYVFDGDTVSLRAGDVDHRVRLQGDRCAGARSAIWDTAKRQLERLVLNKTVRLDTAGRDRYGRLLGKLWVQPADCPRCGRTLDANLAMLTVGAAWWYRAYREDQSEEDQGRYEFAEFEARSKGVGLWQDAHPTAPWDWPRGRDGTQRSSP